MIKRILAAALVLSVHGLAVAGDLPVALQAKIVALLAKASTPPNKLIIKDYAMRAELAKAGVAHDDGAALAWAGTEADVKTLKAAGKLVICGKLEWLASGGSVAMVDEGGRPQLYLHMGNLAAAGAKLPDAIMTAAKKL